MKTAWAALAVLGCIALGLADSPARGGNKGGKKVETRVFELRTYYAAPGKMEALHARFRDHTNKLFENHGMTIVGFWSPTDAKEAQRKLIYILAFPSRAAADKSWKAFREDPEWLRVRTASEKDGKLVEKVDSTYMNPTDYSPIK
jgi:NIPSNAP